VEGIFRLLRERGGRITSARRALVTALLEADSHVTADDLARTVQESNPDVHRSTIYRTLEALERLGVVGRVHLGHGRAVYHLADEVHQHLVCDRCGRVTEVPDAAFDDLTRGLRAAYGFELLSHHFAVLGRCSGCV
jgi:Fur family transcriptional regulator, ferric uptake regulator